MTNNEGSTALHYTCQRPTTRWHTFWTSGAFFLIPPDDIFIWSTKSSVNNKVKQLHYSVKKECVWLCVKAKYLPHLQNHSK